MNYPLGEASGWSSDSILDDAVFDGLGRSVGGVERPRLTPSDIDGFPYNRVVGNMDRVVPGGTCDLIVRAAYDGTLSDDTRQQAVSALDAGGAIRVLARSAEAMDRTARALMRLTGGGHA